MAAFFFEKFSILTKMPIPEQAPDSHLFVF